MKTFIIQDWAGNVMDNAIMISHYKAKMDTPLKEFESFEDAEDFLSEVLDEQYDEDRQEYYIIEKE